MSIERRVRLIYMSIALAGILLLGLLVLAGNRMIAQNARIAALATLADRERERDLAQRDLRTLIGETTRDAERGVAVPPSRWRDVEARLDRFAASTAPRPNEAITPRIAALLSDLAADERAFVSSGRSMLVVGSRSPEALRIMMPEFLERLHDIEDGRMAVRSEITTAMTEASATALDTQRSASGYALLLIWATLTAGWFLMFWIRHRLVKPLMQAAQGLDELAERGETSIDLPLDRPDEIGALARGIEAYRQSIHARQAVERRFEHLANNDALTGLANRRMFEDALLRLIADRQAGPVALLALDLDGFKAVNDQNGHAEGDRLLARVGEGLRALQKPGDLVARIGGDEFAVLQTGAQQPAAALGLAQACIEAVASATASSGQPVGVSVGIAHLLPDSPSDPNDLMHRADAALYRAKAFGRNSVYTYDTVLEAEAIMRRRIKRDLPNALSTGAIYLNYQPIVDVSRARTVCHEAQVRWLHPEIGEVPTDELMLIAEEAGLLGTLTDHVMNVATRTAMAWDADVAVAINLSASDCRDPMLVRRVSQALALSGLPAPRLELEVSENFLLAGDHVESVTRNLRDLKGLGVQLALDEFGNGLSALSNLQRFSFDQLKIDRAFVTGMRGRPADQSIVAAMIGIGRSLDMRVVADGVETRAERDVLLASGCHLMQGYYFGPAQPDGAMLSLKLGGTQRP